jgi:hypothetical protein
MKTPALALAPLLAAALGATASAQSLTTTFAGGNAQDGNMFNIVAKTLLTVDRLEVHFENTNNPAPCGTTCTVNEVEIYTKTASYKGFETMPAAWTLLGSTQHTISTPFGVPQPLDMAIDITLDPSVLDRHGMYVTSTGDLNTVTGTFNDFMSYTDGTAIHENAELRIRNGTGNDYPFGNTFNPRQWNGTVYYTAQGACGSATTNYCTAGTSTAGCQAAIQASGTSSASATGGFFLHASRAEGGNVGFFQFGVGGSAPGPFGASGLGSSLKCVAGSTTRTPVTNLNGRPGFCDGYATVDLNDYWTAIHPGSNPGAGAQVQAQFVYRSVPLGDSRAAVSDALTFAVCP